ATRQDPRRETRSSTHRMIVTAARGGVRRTVGAPGSGTRPRRQRTIRPGRLRRAGLAYVATLQGGRLLVPTATSASSDVKADPCDGQRIQACTPYLPAPGRDLHHPVHREARTSRPRPRRKDAPMPSQAAPAASKGARRTPRRQVHPPRGLGDRLTSGRHRSRTTLDRAATRTAKALLAASISLLTVGLGVPATQAACPNEAVRLEQGFNHLPDCRGYEQVSPPYKEGYEDKGFISSDGTKAILEGSSIVAGTPGTSENVLGSDGYLDQRTPTGWKLTPLNAPLSEFVLQTLIAKEPDSGMTLWVQHLPSQSQAAKGLYAREPGADGKYKYLGPLNVPYAEEPKEPADWGEGTKSEKYYDKPLAATADYSHVVLQDSSSSQFWGFDKTTGVFSVYEYSSVNNEHPVLVGVNSPIKGADEPWVDTCGTQLGSGERGGSLYNSISADGE